MGMEIKSYMGKPGFYMRKYLPHITAFAYLTLQKTLQYPLTKRFIDSFEEDGKRMPLCVSIETVNRCNGECAFCPANRHTDQRKQQIMQESTFLKIMDDLQKADYAGNLLLMNNNEPFLDPHFTERLKTAYRMLPRAKIFIYTNGTLLTPEKLREINGYVHRVIVSNYAGEYKLNESSRKIAEEIQNHPDEYKELSLLLEYRYSGEVLSNRGGGSPNKRKQLRERRYPCAMPFTDVVIYPDGKTGLCCCDVHGRVITGDSEKENVIDIFNEKKMRTIREQAKVCGVPSLEMCRHCDFVGRLDTRWAAIKSRFDHEDNYFDR